MRTVYEIESATDRQGKSKILPEDWTNELYMPDVIIVGRRAVLGKVKNPDKFLHTSTVESFYLYQNYLVITTMNTVYHLKVAGVR